MTLHDEWLDLKSRFTNSKPELEVTLKDDDMGVEGHIVVWNTNTSVGGPLERCGKGGTRISATLSLDEVRMLARKMALKNAAAGLMFGGAKSGIKADQDAPGFEEKYRRFAQLSKPYLFENGGIFGGFGYDMGARPAQAKWVCDELGSLKSFTGKPIDMGGTDYDREGLAGYGVAVAAKRAAHDRLPNRDTYSFAVQGAGAMGAAVIRYFSQMGGHLRALSDPRLGGCWVLQEDPHPDLILAIALMNFDQAKGYLQNMKAECLDDLSAVLYHDADVLFPCAIHDVLTPDNADKVKAKVIVEGANGPCRDDVYDVFQTRDIFVVPDFLANAGGIIAAYVEMTEDCTVEDNILHKIKTKKAFELTREKMTKNVDDLFELIHQGDLQARQASEYIALKRLFST